MNDPIMGMNRVQIKQMQERKLRSFFKEQLPFHPYYSERFKDLKIDPCDIRTISDLQKLPLTKKEDIAPDKEDPERYKKFVLQPTLELIKAAWPKGRLIKFAAQKAMGKDIKAMLHKEYFPVHLIATSGTTGINTPFLFSKTDLDTFGRSYVRSGEIIKLSKEGRTIDMFPFAPHLAFYFALLAAFKGGWFIYHTGGGAVTSTAKAIELSMKLKPTSYAGIPSYIYHFCLKALEAGVRIDTVDKILTAGERFPDALKLKIERLMNELGSPDVSVHDVYGTTELRTACPECHPHTNAFHTHPDLHIYELVDPETGEQVAEGERGALAITNIDGRGTTVVRYLIGDIFEKGMETDACPHCGTYLPRLMGPVGRMKDYDERFQLTNIKGTLVNLYNFHEILPSMDAVSEWQVVISKKNDDPFEIDELTINVAPKAGADKESMIRNIQQKINCIMELTPKVNILNVDVLFDQMGGHIKPMRIMDRRTSPKATSGPSGADGPRLSK